MWDRARPYIILYYTNYDVLRLGLGLCLCFFACNSGPFDVTPQFAPGWSSAENVLQQEDSILLICSAARGANLDECQWDEDTWKGLLREKGELKNLSQ